MPNCKVRLKKYEVKMLNEFYSSINGVLTKDLELTSKLKLLRDLLLCKKLLTHAKRTGIERVEATVINHNHKSLNLCKKLGFKIEGIKRCSIKIGDKFHDEYLLSMMMSSYLH